MRENRVHFMRPAQDQTNYKYIRTPHDALSNPTDIPRSFSTLSMFLASRPFSTNAPTERLGGNALGKLLKQCK